MVMSYACFGPIHSPCYYNCRATDIATVGASYRVCSYDDIGAAGILFLTQLAANVLRVTLHSLVAHYKKELL